MWSRFSIVQISTHSTQLGKAQKPTPQISESTNRPVDFLVKAQWDALVKLNAGGLQKGHSDPVTMLPRDRTCLSSNSKRTIAQNSPKRKFQSLRMSHGSRNTLGMVEAEAQTALTIRHPLGRRTHQPDSTSPPKCHGHRADNAVMTNMLLLARLRQPGRAKCEKLVGDSFDM